MKPSEDSASQNSLESHGDGPGPCRVEEAGNMEDVVAEEGGGEQAAEALNGEVMACCHGNSDSACLMGEEEPLHNALEPDPGPPNEAPEPGAEEEQTPNSAQNQEETAVTTPQNDPDAESSTTTSSSSSVEESSSAAGGSTSPPAAVSSPAEDIPEQELYNSFHYWRTPIPTIDLDLELQQSAEERERERGESHGASPSRTGFSSGACNTGIPSTLGRRQLQELIENLEPHTDDPDVKGKVHTRWQTPRPSYSLDSS